MSISLFIRWSAVELAGARAEPEHLEERVRLGVGELAQLPYSLQPLLARAEDPECAFDLTLVRLLRLAPGVVGRPHPARIGAADDERRGALRVGRGEENAHRRPLGEPVEGSTARGDCVHDRPNVVHARLQRRGSADAVGHARAALVEPNQPAEGGQFLEKGREARHGPVELEVRDVARDEHEVERPLAGDLVGDVDVAALRVLNVGGLHRDSVCRF